MQNTVKAQTASWKRWMKKLWGSKHRTHVMAVYPDSNMAGSNNDTDTCRIVRRSDSNPVIHSPSCPCWSNYIYYVSGLWPILLLFCCGTFLIALSTDQTRVVCLPFDRNALNLLFLLVKLSKDLLYITAENQVFGEPGLCLKLHTLAIQSLFVFEYNKLVPAVVLNCNKAKS